MLAAVPSCAGQCRFVRGDSVGIAAVDAGLWGFCGDARGPASRLGGTPGPVGAYAGPVLRSLADKVNWLTGRARPAGRGSCSNAEVAGLIERTTGERVSHTTIWKPRNGQAANPPMKLTGAMARPVGVPPGFFLADYGTGQAGLLHEEAELLALVRSASISPAQLRPILGLSPAARQAITYLIAAVTAAR
jgi:ESX-1-secreted protein regulator